MVPRGYWAGRNPCPTTFTSNSISGAKTTVTSASVWYSRSGRRFHQPSGWQIKEKMIPGQPVTLQWDNGCFCYSFVFFKGERGGREGGRGGRKRRRGWGEEGGREGGRKGQHPCESRGNTCPPPWRTPDSASLSPEMLPVEGGGPAQPRPPTSSIPSPRSSLIGPHLHTSCGFERITKTTSSAQRSPSSHAATRIFPKGLLLRRQAQVKKKKKKKKGRSLLANQLRIHPSSHLESFSGLRAARNVYFTLFIWSCPRVTSAPSLSPQGTCLK